MKELGGYTQLALPSGRTFHSLMEDWVNELTMMLMDVSAHKAVVCEIEKKYFNGHPILYCDAEAKLAETIKSIKDAISTFNEYLTTRLALFTKSDPENRANA